MGRITLGDMAIAGVLTAIMVVAIIVASALLFHGLLGFSADEYSLAVLVTVNSFFIGGGVMLGLSSRRAGYPVLTTWAWGAGIILVIYFVLAVAGRLSVSPEVVPWIVLMMAEVLLALLFVVGLAGFLNARYAGMPTQRSFGTRPSQMATGVTIYKSNQPDIYQGIRELDFGEKAPGSLYRGRR